MCQVLEHIRGVLVRRSDLALGEDLIQHDVVVGWACRALDGGMGLYEEVPIAGFGDAAIDAGAVFGVARAIGVGFLCGIEARMVALADNDDGDFWKPFLGVGGRVYVGAGFANQGKLGVDDDVVLPFGDTVPVDEEAFGERSVFASGFPEAEARGDHAVEFSNHFLTGQVCIVD